MLQWQSIEEFGSITGPAGAAAMYTVVIHYLSSNAAELWSELLCWILLPILFRNTLRSSYSLGDSKGSKNSLPSPILRSHGLGVAAGSIPLWAVAFAIAVVSVYRAECKTIVVFLVSIVSIIILLLYSFLLLTNRTSSQFYPRSFCLFTKASHDPISHHPILRRRFDRKYECFFLIHYLDHYRSDSLRPSHYVAGILGHLPSRRYRLLRWSSSTLPLSMLTQHIEYLSTQKCIFNNQSLHWLLGLWSCSSRA